MKKSMRKSSVCRRTTIISLTSNVLQSLDYTYSVTRIKCDWKSDIFT